MTENWDLLKLNFVGSSIVNSHVENVWAETYPSSHNMKKYNIVWQKYLTSYIGQFSYPHVKDGNLISYVVVHLTN